MSLRTYATFDETTANLGASLVLADGDTDLQTSANVNAHRHACGTIYQSDFLSEVEFYVYSPDGTAPSLVTVAGVPPVCVGLRRSTASKNTFVGEETLSIGLAASGEVFNNNAVLTTLTGYTYGQRVKITLDKPSETIFFEVDGQPVGSVATPASGQSWTFAATVSGAPGARGVKEYAGGPDQTMRYSSDSGNGWWQALPGIAPALLASDYYMTAATDTPRHEKYDGDLDNASQPIALSGGYRPWVFGASAPSVLGQQGLVQFQVNDLTRKPGTDGKWSRLLDPASKNTRVTFAVAQDGVAFAGAPAIFTGQFDRAEELTLQTLRCYVRSMADRLRVALRRALFPPDAASGLANQKRPVMLGPSRNYVPPLEVAAAKQYALGDSPMTTFGTNRAAGKPRIYGTDDQVTQDAQSMFANVEPVGKYTIESSSTGEAYDPGLPDYLSAEGVFTSATADGNGHPTNWATVGITPNYTGLTGTQLWQLNQYSNSGLVQDCGIAANRTIWIKCTDASKKLRAGRSYSFRIDVTKCPLFGGGNSSSNNTYASRAAVLGVAVGTQNNYGVLQALDTPSGGAKTLTGTITNSASTDQPMYLVLQTNGLTYAPSLDLLVIADVKLNELPAVTDSAPLPGLTLTQIVNELAVVRGPLVGGEVGTSESDAIDAATNYVYGISVKAGDDPSVIDCLQLVHDSYTGAGDFDGSGIYHCWELVAPEDQPDSAVAFELLYDAGDFLTELEPIDDLAEGLSSRACGRENIEPYADGDFSDTTLADCSNETRALLKKKYQYTESAGVDLDPIYWEAYTRAPHKTLLDQRAHIKDMIVRANKLYGKDKARRFYKGDVWMPPTRRRWNGSAWVEASGIFTPGMFFDASYPYAQWSTGKMRLVLLGYEGLQPSKHTCGGAIFWGLKQA